MATLIAQVMDKYQEYMDRADPRTANYLLVESPWPNLALVVGYVYVVKLAGPRFMKDREPYNIRTLMVIYNFFMVILSAYMVWEFLWAGWLTEEYSVIGCQPVDYSSTPQALRMTRVSWLFFISKYIEFLDTIFFVLRKKFSHVSVLHVFHHGSLPMFIWAGVKYVPGGFGTFFCMLNSSVHTMMYLYYGISALGPEYRKYLWWKKYMTIYQLVQFTMMFVHGIQVFLLRDCQYPWQFGIWILFFSSVFFYLFIDFYVQAYRRPKKVQDAAPRTKQVHSHSNGYNGYAVSNGKIHMNGHCNGMMNGIKRE